MASMPVSKTAHAGSNPASPAKCKKTGIQIFSEVSVFFCYYNSFIVNVCFGSKKYVLEQ